MEKKFRHIIDMLMVLDILLLMGYQITGQYYHEIAGTVMILLAIIHTVFNWNWYQGIKKGKYSRTRIYITIVNFGLLLMLVLLAWSGITMSGYVFSFIPLRRDVAVARRVHLAASNWCFVLIGIHLGNHWRIIQNRMLGKKNGVMKKIYGVIVLIFFVMGGYFFTQSGMIQNMLFLSQYEKIKDISEIRFFAEQFVMLSFFTTIGYWIFKVCSGDRKQERESERKEKDEVSKTKKKWIIRICLLTFIGILFYFFGIRYIQRHFVTNEISVKQKVAGNHAILERNDKILTVYFTRLGNTDFEKDVDAVASASLITDHGTMYGNSQVLAQMVQSIAGGEIYPIEVEKKYPSSYADTVRVANDELSKKSRPKLSGEKIDVTDYDTVVLIYPVWWNHIPMPVVTFLEEYDWTGMTILPIATHGGSGEASTVEDIRKITKAKVGAPLTVFDDEVKDARDRIISWLGNQ